ncbi:hypothetical protein ACLOJK_030426 [Asimina triloba]
MKTVEKMLDAVNSKDSSKPPKPVKHLKFLLKVMYRLICQPMEFALRKQRPEKPDTE